MERIRIGGGANACACQRVKQIAHQIHVVVALGKADFQISTVRADQNAPRLVCTRQDGTVVENIRLHAFRQVEGANVGQNEAVTADIVARTGADGLRLPGTTGAAFFRTLDTLRLF